MIWFRIVFLFAICAIVGAALAGCAKPEPIVHVVTVNAVRDLPAECEAPDPAWVELPEREILATPEDARLLARNHRANKDQYQRVLGARQVCRVAVAAAKSPRPSK